MTTQLSMCYQSCYLAQAGKTAPLRWFCTVLFVVCMLASCATNRGIVEFGAYRDAYVSTAETGQSILDRLALVEREIHDLKSPPINATNISFNPNEASYYSKAVDPPATAAFRRALRAIQMYNDALYGLASGQSAEAMLANISRLGAVGTSAVGEITSFAPEIVVAATAVNATINALQPLTSFVFKFKTREEFREKLLSQYDTIDQILETTRDKTSVIFDAFFASMVHANTGVDSIPAIFEGEEEKIGELGNDDKQKIKQTRELLSNWVILLDGSRLALQQAVFAIKDTSNTGSAAGLIFTVTELGTAARLARMNLAETAN